MSTKQLIAESKLVLFIRLLGQYWQEILLFSRELGHANTRKNSNKFKANFVHNN